MLIPADHPADHKGAGRIGFIGTGTITEAMVKGLKTSALRDHPLLLSPRNAETAARLATAFAGVRVAADNQAVLEGADLVILAVRPQVAEPVIRSLRFRADHAVISVIAGVSVAALCDWTGLPSVTRAIPLPFVAQHKGVTPIYPPDPAAARLFNALGQAVEVDSLAEYDAFAAASALMGSYFGLLDLAADWLETQGLGRAAAETYLRGLFHNLGQVMADSPGRTLTELRDDHSTRGGLNEAAFRRFVETGGGAALRAGLDTVLDRLRGRAAPGVPPGADHPRS
jgi:pyrroline-5-carboxylate reductase